MNKFSSKYLVEKNININYKTGFFTINSLFVNLEYHDNVIFKVSMAIDVDLENLSIIKNNCLLNLSKDSLNGQEFPKFNNLKKIEVTAFLNPEFLTDLSINSAQEFIREFDQNNLFNDESFWYWDIIKQDEILPQDLKELGNLSSGIKSYWVSNIYKSVNKVESPLFKDIYNFFNKAFQNIQITEFGKSFEFDLSKEIDNCSGAIILLELKKIVIFYIKIPTSKSWNEIKEIIGKINYDLPVGNFEYNEELNIVRFKTSIDYQNVNITYPMLQNLYQANYESVNKYVLEF